MFAEEIAPIEIAQPKGGVLRIIDDEGVRPDASTASLAGLAPAFASGGTITAASSSPISDGAAAVVVMSREVAQRHGLRWIAEIGAHGAVAGPDSSLQSQPAPRSGPHWPRTAWQCAI